MLNSASIRNVKFIKNAKARNVYHRCLCFIFDQTAMPTSKAREKRPGDEVEKSR